MFKFKKTDNKKVSIRAILPIPLEDLAEYTREENKTGSDVIQLLRQEPESVSKIIREVIRDVLSMEKEKIELVSLEYSYSDSCNISHGIAYFNAELKGNEQDLRKITGEDGLFYYEWEENLITD